MEIFTSTETIVTHRVPKIYGLEHSNMWLKLNYFRWRHDRVATKRLCRIGLTF